MKRSRLLMTFCLLLPVFVTGCGTDNMQVTIQDGYTKTQLEARQGQSVEDILKEADIVIGEQDVVEPELRTSLYLPQYEITILRHAKVQVVTEEKTVDVELTGKSVGDALQEAGVTLLKNDYVNHPMDAYLVDGMSVSVAHRLEISLQVDGTKETYLTQAGNVKEFLAEQEVELGELDRVKPSLNSSLSDGSTVVVKRVEVKEVVENEPIAFETEVTYSNSMTVGTSKILKAGVDGEKRVTYEVTYVDGKEESRKAIKEEVLKEAVTQEVVQGSKPKRTVVSKEYVDDCDGSGHGYCIITYSDGTQEHVEY